MPTTKMPTNEPELPHGALGEIREDIFLPPKKSQLRVPLPKTQRPSEPSQQKKRRSTRR